MYGGAGGGGKSDALLMAALQYAQFPRYSAIIFRRTLTDLTLPEALIPRSHEWLTDTDAEWHEQASGSVPAKTWHFPAYDSTLSFGYMDSENDKYRYASSAYQYIAFDELTQFTATMYTFPFSRLRRLEGSAVPLRMRSATNPGGVGHEWVKARFVDPGDPGRPFFPARLSDNPHIDQDEYTQSLMLLDPITRQQILDGVWTATHAQSIFRREWFSVIDQVPADMERHVRFWDFAATPKSARSPDPDWTVGARVGFRGGVYYIEDVVRRRDTPAEIERLVRHCADADGVDVPVRWEEEAGASGKQTSSHLCRNVLVGYDARGVRKRQNKIASAGPWASAAQVGNVSVLRGPWNAALFDEIEGFPTGAHDDQVDAVSGATAFLGLGYLDPTVGVADSRRRIAEVEESLEALMAEADPAERAELEKELATIREM